ncbi:hypothetical protein OG369_39890 [Streptomyces sp. NBC_01221]|uniref:hypothetical protein n=1 Tax=Streptomyces sp. NBC_01221 TaxID=2903782 RepID=UPI0022557B89|nr:hypothetical protein [Streptomyces sp. NBC_01221]MCX4792012.1 hypothetical protein [Streptomyces sp. NBC_01221]
MTAITLSEDHLDSAPPSAPIKPATAPPEMVTADSVAAFRAAPKKSLSFGLGLDSTGVLLSVLDNPADYGVAKDYSDFFVMTALTGFEFPDTIAAVQKHVLPRLREKGIRYVQVARAGHRDGDGVEVVSDTTNPGKVFSRGQWTLMDELEANGTVPQYAGGHLCSLKYKAWPQDRLQLDQAGGQKVGKLFGYNADEYKRAAKANKHQARRDKEAGTQTFALDYPLIRLGLDREGVKGYVKERLGVAMPKSYCPVCPFSGVCSPQPDHLERLRKFPALAARVLRLEYVSMALNANSSLYKDDTLFRRVTDDQNADALGEFATRLDEQDWSVYRLQRAYTAGRRPECRTAHGDRCAKPECRDSSIKGTVYRSVKTVRTGTRAEAGAFLHNAAVALDRPVEHSTSAHGAGIDRVRTRVRPDAKAYGTVEDFYVAAPAGVQDKARDGFAAVWAQMTDSQ